MIAYIDDYVDDIENHKFESSSETYPAIRQILASEYQDASAEDIEAVVEDAFGEGVSAEELEDYLENLNGLINQGASTGGMLIGGAVGGPIGAAVGKVAGGVAAKGIGSLVSRLKRRRRRKPKVKVSRGRVKRSARRSAPGAKRRLSQGRQPAPVGASAPANQLLQMLSNPKLMQMLTALVAGQAGRKNFRLAGRSVPVGAIPNAISTLAKQVAEDYEAIARSDDAAFPEYLLDAEGEFLVDPASPDERAQLIVELLEEDRWLAVADAETDDETDDATMRDDDRYALQLGELREAVYTMLADYYDDLDDDDEEDEDEFWDDYYDFYDDEED